MSDRKTTAKPLDLRAAILKRLKAAKKTVYWLAMHEGITANERSVRNYLAGRTNANAELIGQILGVLKMNLVPTGDLE